jgi:hypothetical protein
MIERDLDRLLLVCVKARYDRKAFDQATCLASDSQVCWERFLQQAAKHAVAPLIYDTLREDSDLLPAWVKQELLTAYYQTAARNTLLYQESASIMRWFQRANVPVILLKGGCLALRVYGNPALRPMSDLDLLVPSSFLLGVGVLFAEKGYTVLEGAESHLRHMTFQRPDSDAGPHLEIHSHIVSSPYYRRAVPEEWLWRDPVELLVDGVPALGLSPQASIVHSCLHFLDHTGSTGTLLWLCDIAEVARGCDLDWSNLIRTLGEFKLILPVRAVLSECQELLGLPVPAELWRQLLSYRPGFTENKAYQFCLSPQRSTASKTIFDFLTANGLRARARLLSSRLLPSPQYMIKRYSIRNWSLVPLYYPRMILGAAFDAFKALRR